MTWVSYLRDVSRKWLHRRILDLRLSLFIVSIGEECFYKLQDTMLHVLKLETPFLQCGYTYNS